MLSKFSIDQPIMSGTLIIFMLLLPIVQPFITKSADSYPCPYADTMNITDGLRLKDGSYSFAGVIVPVNLIAEYDFKVIDGIEYRAPRHVRGCVCRIRSCISFCCPADLVFNPKHLNCTRPEQGFNLPSLQKTHIEVTNLTNVTNAATNVVNIQERFVIRTELGCRNKFIDKKNDGFWKWDIFENGSLARDGRIWTTDEYCFTALEHKEAWSLVPLNCERFQRGYRVWIYVICTILAVVTNVFILSLLLSIREARKSHYGEVIIYYLISVITASLGLIYLSMKNPMNLSHAACRNIGFLTYFFVMLSFIYLAFCSFDFWFKFKQRTLPVWLRKIILLLAIPVALGLRFLTSFAQDSNMPRHFKPGIGDDYCWFDVRTWGILIYYYIPIMAMVLFSLGCCLRSYFNMWNLPNDAKVVAGINLRILRSHFYAFSAYLIAVFLVWAREMIVYIMARAREHFFIIDFWSGICIFALAMVGFISLLGKNRYVQTWWAINVESSQTDLSIINARVYQFDEHGAVTGNDADKKQRVTSL